jgi:hypothetical protein
MVLVRPYFDGGNYMYWLDASQSYVGSPAQQAFYADEESDIQNLPTSKKEGVKQGKDTTSYKKTAKGSSCFVIATSEVYVLNSEDVWKKI